MGAAPQGDDWTRALERDNNTLKEDNAEFKLQLANVRELNDAIVAENADIKTKLKEAKAVNATLVAQANAASANGNANTTANSGMPSMQNNFAPGATSYTYYQPQHHHHHYDAPTEPPTARRARALYTPTQATTGMRKLTINEDTDMGDDDGIPMPRYKEPCMFERQGRGCTNPRCVHLHQCQVDKFSAEDIDALPLNRRMTRRDRRRG
jgi:hypothetical protein